MRTRYLLLTAIWGASFLLIKVGLEAFAPLQIVLGRLVVGALVLIAVLAARREPLPRDLRLWAHAAVAATLLNTVPFTLFAYAEQRIPSVATAICNATTPLFTLLVALVALREERPTARGGAGLVLGFAGVIVVLGAWRGTATGPDPLGVTLALIAAACYGIGGVYLRRYLAETHVSALALSTMQLVIGALEAALVVPLVSRAPWQLPPRAVLAVLTLGVLGTGLAYTLQQALIRTVGATVTSTVAYGIPLVSIALGVVVLGEELAWNAPIGAAIIIAGAVLSRTVPRPATPAQPRHAPAAVHSAPASLVPSWPRGPS